jgi:hypothetical protein
VSLILGYALGLRESREYADWEGLREMGYFEGRGL